MGGARRSDEPEEHAPALERDYIDRNRGAWESWAPAHVDAAASLARELRWGIWGIPESEIRLLEGLEPGSDAIELGCGTAAISAGLARQGSAPLESISSAPSSRRLLASRTSSTFVRSCLRERGKAPIRRRELRPGGLGLRRQPLVRSAPLASRGPSCAPTARKAHLHHAQRASHGVHAETAACRRLAGAGSFLDVQARVPRRTTRWNSISHTDNGCDSCGTGFVLDDLIEVQPPPGARPSGVRLSRVGETLAQRGHLGKSNSFRARAAWPASDAS